MPQKRAQLTDDVLAYVRQFGKQGVPRCVITEQFKSVDSNRVSVVLRNMQMAGEMYLRDGCWFAGSAPSSTPITTFIEHKRIARARELDRRDPLVFYGQGLVAPRCPSVWAYARSFKEARA